MADSSDNQVKKAVNKAAAAAKTPGAASQQDQMWKKFDAMLQEFLRMEQTSPAAEKQPVRTAR
jgi:hypothetical protein